MPWRNRRKPVGFRVGIECDPFHEKKSTIAFEATRGNMVSRKIDDETCGDLIKKLKQMTEENPLELVIKQDCKKIEVSQTYTYR